MTKLVNLAIRNTIFRGEYEENEYWFAQLPENLTPLFEPILSLILAIELYPTSSEDPMEEQNLITTICENFVDDNREQNIRVGNFYTISADQYAAAQTIQPVTHLDIYTWDEIIQSLSYGFAEFIDYVRDLDRLDEFKSMLDKSDHATFFHFLFDLFSNSDEVGLNSMIHGNFENIIQKLEVLAKELDKNQLTKRPLMIHLGEQP